MPLPEGRGAEKDFTGFAVFSTALFPLKGEDSNHKGIFDEACGSEERDVQADTFNSTRPGFSVLARDTAIPRG